MRLTREELHEILVPPGHVSEEDFSRAAERAERDGTTIEETLVGANLISEKNLSYAIAGARDYIPADLESVSFPDELLALIPEIVARAQEAVIFEQDGTVLRMATTNPDNYEFIKLLEKRTGLTVKPFYASIVGIREALRSYKGNIKKELEERIKAAHNEEEDAISIVNLLLEYAYSNRASDIHIEPLEETVTVRFRIDGVLHRVIEYPKVLHEKIIFRIKILSRLRTDEHAAAQDGRFDHQLSGTTFDVRVSIMPVTNGENAVMRLLVNNAGRLSLEELGLRGRDLEVVHDALSKTQGMILSVGPTGSGKTTTLYSLLQILNKPEVNIMTIEDPVEYDIEHIQQTQVNANKNLTFATGLRSIVRQDPDIIMVGEIRDDETADIAVNAAMTGHLLLSTLHTNDAATTFPRLMEMGVEPFLVASSIRIIISQRLVRKVCDACKSSYLICDDDQEIINHNEEVGVYLQEITRSEHLGEIRMYRGMGCKACGNTGYSGRTGIFEVLEVNEEIRTLIANKTSSEIITEAARKHGLIPVLYNGIEKALEGITTLEEVLRVSKA